MSPRLRLSPAWTTVLLIVGIAASITAMGWFGYRALSGWRHSAVLLADQRASETADRLATVLNRDMRGVQSTVLASAQWDQFMLDSPFDVRNLAASAFARYPYPESFFAWRGVPTPEAIVFLDRSDRRPPWMPGDGGRNLFPVIVEYEPAVARMLLARIVDDAHRRRRFSIFGLTLAGNRYQIVARLLYRDALREHLEGVFGFTVNLAWVKQHYFPEVTRQVSRMDPSRAGLGLALFDDSGTLVARSSDRPLREPVWRHELPLMFFDPLLVAVDPPADLTREVWMVAAGAGDDPALNDAIQGGNRTMLVASLAVGLFAVGLFMTLRATRASSRLAELRSDFVSSVTHELKTPIATIRAAGDTMARGRVSSPEALTDCAYLVVEESKRLTRLVDNLLAYSRITDVTEAYTFEPIEPAVLMGEALGGFRRTIETGGFDVQLDIPPDIPAINGDRTSCLLLFDNLIDNALRYSPAERHLTIRARQGGSTVTIAITDRGQGIPADELPKVTRKFFRGRRSVSGGSGLGLAIASRIATDHGGTIRIESQVDVGTTVSVTLPAAEAGNEEAHPGR